MPVGRGGESLGNLAALEGRGGGGQVGHLRFNGEIDTVLALRTDDGLITGIYAMRNPEKLSHMQRETALRR